MRGSAWMLAVLLALAPGAVACSKHKQAATTPAGGSQGTMTYEDLPGAGTPAGATPAGAAPGAGDQVGTAAAGQPAGAAEVAATQPSAPQPRVPPPPPPPKPPGNDLSPERRAQVVAERLRKAEAGLAGRDTDAAIREARAALDADETSVPAMVILAHAYFMKGYDDKSAAILDIALKRPEGPKHPTIWMLKGLVADRGVDREDEALDAYLKATGVKPDYAAAWTNVGAIYLKRKRCADAAEVFEKVTQLRPRSARAWVGLGSALRGRSAEIPSDQEETRSRLLGASEEKFKRAMAIDPTYAPAHFNLGLLYLDADPFPGLETLPRLKLAKQYLAEYKRLAGTNLKPGDPVDDYLAAAQKAEDREVKRLEKKRLREEKERAKQQGSAAGGGGAQP